MPHTLEPAQQDHSAQASWIVRNGVWVTGLSLIFPNLIGSVFNIAYNVVHVDTLLNKEQLARFMATIGYYNMIVYPITTVILVGILRGLQRTFGKLLRAEPVNEQRLLRARRMAINLPWWGAGLGSVGWFLCIPVFLGSLTLYPDRLDPRVYAHLTTSFLISGLIATTHGFFILELFAQSLLYPVFFRDFPPAKTPGARPLSLRSRGWLWVLSAGVCPIGSLLLLMLVPQDHSGVPWFALSVGGIGVAFGMTTAWLVGRWVTEPVDRLKIAARAVAAGDLRAHVDLLRADDFGPLIDEFNQMVVGLRDKQRLQEMFGRHVGRQAAQLILDRDPGLGGFEETVTVVFVDIRDFTPRCERSSPQRVVDVLNTFFTEMVDIIEKHGGIVNKFLGDGFMAIFGVGIDSDHHADAAVAAGREMLAQLETINRSLAEENRDPLEIGIGIHTGPAIVGSIGSPKRMEFTAIGDTVNIASRVEGLTKTADHPLLMTSATRNELQSNIEIKALAPQPVKGQSKPLAVFEILD